MEFEIEDTDFAYNLIVSLRNQLVNGDDKTLVELYKNSEEDFYNFLLANIYLMEMEPNFYLLDKRYLQSVLNIISIYRSSMDSDSKEYVNDVITFTNRISSLNEADKKKSISSYLEYQQDLRRVDFDNKDEFVRSLSYDGVVLQSLYDNSLDHIEEDNLFLMSVNYFLEVMPSIFLDDDNYKLVKKVANRYKDSLKFYQLAEKRYAVDTLTLVQDTNNFYHDVLQKVK